MAQVKNWEQVAGKWGNLSDDELMQVNGRRDILVRKIQEKYGIASDEANKQLDEWVSKLKM